MKKNIYGNIEDMLVHVKMVTPMGQVQKNVQVRFNVEVILLFPISIVYVKWSFEFQKYMKLYVYTYYS